MIKDPRDGYEFVMWPHYMPTGWAFNKNEIRRIVLAMPTRMVGDSIMDEPEKEKAHEQNG